MERWPQGQVSPLKGQVWRRSSGVFEVDRGVSGTLQELNLSYFGALRASSFFFYFYYYLKVNLFLAENSRRHFQSLLHVGNQSIEHQTLH